MPVIKISNKEIINLLQAKLTLHTGRRFSQQEIVDLCVDYAKDNIDELIFCNDSCFGPIGINGFKDLFETMERKSSDFWGISINNFGLEKQVQDYVYVQNKPHVQSYFFVCTYNPVQSSVFVIHGFISAI